LSPDDIQSGRTDWEGAVRSVVEEWIGPERRAGRGVYRAGERHAEAIRNTRFREAKTTDINVTQEWSVDQIIGYLFSTSYASHAVLRDKAQAFAQAIRQRLLEMRADGEFEKVVEYSVISATRRK
jgi:hypothetical protein